MEKDNQTLLDLTKEIYAEYSKILIEYKDLQCTIGKFMRGEIPLYTLAEQCNESLKTSIDLCEKNIEIIDKLALRDMINKMFEGGTK